MRMKSYSDNYVNIIIAHICTQVFDFKLCDEDMKVIESFNRNERFIVPAIMVSIKCMLCYRFEISVVT